MAKLLKIYILGIRSFGPTEEDVQQLKFCSPVTLLLGQNGCGKTTVIESIRYACTGEVPLGSSNGQGFINDPNLSGRNIIKGQVRLKVLDAQGNEVSIYRVAEVRLKAGNKMTYSSKNPTIRIVDMHGQEVSTSGRCVDAKNYICQNVLNISPSILNNVMFCHQENAAWPLEEGQKVKEKFDEIFDAKKYNKCADEIRKQLKERSARVKTLLVELDWKKESKEKVEKFKRHFGVKREKMNTLEEEVAQKRTELAPIVTRIREIQQLEMDLGELQGKLAAKEETKKGVIEQQTTIKQNIDEEFAGNDEELNEEIESFENNRKKDEKMIEDLDQRKASVDSRAKAVLQTIQEIQNKIGKYNQEMVQYQRECKERKSYVDKAIAALNLTEVTADYNNPENCKLLINQLKEALESTQFVLCSLGVEKEEQESALQKSIDELREKHASAKQNISSKSGEIDKSSRKIAEIENQLDELNSTSFALTQFANKLQELEQASASLKSQLDENTEIDNVNEMKRTIATKEGHLEVLERDARILQQNDITDGKIDTERHTVLNKKRHINSTLSKHNEDLSKIFSAGIPKNNLRHCVQTILNKEDSSVKLLTNEIASKEKELTKIEAKLSSEEKNIKQYEAELSSKKKQISDVCKGRDFFQVLDQVQEKRKKLQTDRGYYSSAHIIYDRFIQEFQTESPSCPVCMTDFTQKRSTIVDVVRNLRSKLKTIPAKLADVELELRKEEELYDKLQQLKPINDDVRSITDAKLPRLKKDVAKLNQELNGRKEEVNVLKTRLVEPVSIVESCRKVISDLASVDQSQSDLEKSEKTIAHLQEQIVKVASNKSKQEIEAQIDLVKNEIHDARNVVDSLQKKITQHKDRLQKITDEHRLYLTKQMKIEKQHQSRPHLESQQEEHRERVRTLTIEIETLKIQCQDFHKDLIKALQHKDEVVKSNKNLLEKERRKIDENHALVTNVVKIQAKIEAFLKLDIEGTLKKAEIELVELKENCETLERTKNKIADAITKKKESLAKENINLRALQDNVILRQKRQQEKQLDMEIKNLKQRIGDFNCKSVRTERTKLESQYSALQQTINGLNGQKQELAVSLEEMSAELEKPENKNAHKVYISKYCELFLARKIVTDLTKFVTALEKSILDFHKSKMVQINRSIKEHWRNIYRGNDIDHIEIKTEFAGGTGAKRTYNYRVVQVKRGIEMEMRGRCSAGQRVLACLIIRMAIAEILSSHCGILALDEPTTNLDRENIHSLSEALSRIIELRQKERNFQLVIITHDEEFLNTLTRNQSIDHYFRVARNNDGYSVITKQYTEDYN